MELSDISDPLFRSAVEAIDKGDISSLNELLHSDPSLISRRLDSPTEGYFQRPYLLWFIAGNPVRHEKLSGNIVEVTRVLIEFARENAKDSFQQQIDYTLGLVATGRVPRDCGVQIPLIDLLIDNGAVPGNGQGALANGNIEAARHLIKRSGILTLSAAVCLNQRKDVENLLRNATNDEKQVALIAAAFYGNADIIELLIQSGVDVNAYIKKGFHTHASALHQAVFSGSLAAVKLLVEARADRNAVDKVYNATPLDWAIYMKNEENGGAPEKYLEIENYLRLRQDEHPDGN